MKLHLNKIALILMAVAIISGCKREFIANPDQYTKVYMPQALEYPKVSDLFMADTVQSIIFGAAFGGVNEQTNTVNVKFKVDPSLVAVFNTKNNTNYLVLPQNSYEVTGTQATMANGKVNTNALKIKIKTVGGIEPIKEYLLPVSIEQVSPALPVNDSLRTTYFKIRGTYADFTRSSWQVVAVSSLESTNPGSNVLDGNTGTNWHTQWRTAKPPHPHWITIDMKESKKVHGFYFWPASTSNGNPADIHIDLSADGTNWQSGGDFTLVNTFERQVVYLSSTVSARYFKVTINSSTGNTHFTHPTEIGAF